MSLDIMKLQLRNRSFLGLLQGAIFTQVPLFLKVDYLILSIPPAGEEIGGGDCDPWGEDVPSSLKVLNPIDAFSTMALLNSTYP